MRTDFQDKQSEKIPDPFVFSSRDDVMVSVIFAHYFDATRGEPFPDIRVFL